MHVQGVGRWNVVAECLDDIARYNGMLLCQQQRWPCAGTSPKVIRAALLGHTNLPWEDASEGSLSALRTLRHSVMSCLCRYAERRPSADELAASWRNLLEFSAVKHTVVNP